MPLRIPDTVMLSELDSHKLASICSIQGPASAAVAGSMRDGVTLSYQLHSLQVDGGININFGNIMIQKLSSSILMVNWPVLISKAILSRRFELSIPSLKKASYVRYVIMRAICTCISALDMMQ